MSANMKKTQHSDSKYSTFRSSSVLPPLPGTVSDMSETSKNFELPEEKRPHSDLTSVYKLDTNSPKPVTKHDQNKVEKLFQKMKLEDRNAIIDRIHKMRL